MNSRIFLVTVAFTFGLNCASHALSQGELNRIGRRVWQNECGGTRDGLTSWNTGEAFASLGIGHFIWYPKGGDGPFEESFPALAKFLASRGTNVPDWLRGDCPWKTRGEFLAEFHSPRMESLRELLASTVSLQSEFLAQRMRAAMPKMLSAAPAGDRAKVKANFDRLAASGAGTFALIDYVNFKGEGTNPKERYHGQGWGLLQVLTAMDESGNAPAAFGKAAAATLERRVKNAPAERNEGRWLPGWKNRVRAYSE